MGWLLCSQTLKTPPHQKENEHPFMRRYWIDKDSLKNDQVHLSGDVFHHIFDVCRQDLGSEFEVLTEEGKAYRVKVDNKGKKEAVAHVISSRTLPLLPRPWVHLVLSIPRFPVFDAVIEKAVELGVKSIQPVFSDHSFVRKSDSISENKFDRWQKIIRSATQQSNRGDLMELNSPVDLKEFLNKINQTEGWEGLFAYEGDSPIDIKSYLSQKSQTRTLSPSDLWIFVGSEGGFSLEEVELLTKAGLKPVTLGSQVLRVETACVTLVSVQV